MLVYDKTYYEAYDTAGCLNQTGFEAMELFSCYLNRAWVHFAIKYQNANIYNNVSIFIFINIINSMLSYFGNQTLHLLELLYVLVGQFSRLADLSMTVYMYIASDQFNCALVRTVTVHELWI